MYHMYGGQIGMNESTEFSMRVIAIEDWMIDLVEDDRPACKDAVERLTDLHWIYTAALVRFN